MCHEAADWVSVLSTVLLGLRTHVRLDTGASPAEFIYGTTLRVPGEFFLYGDFSPDPKMFIEDFREYMQKVRPIPTVHHNKKRPFFFKELRLCTHVFLHTDTVKRPLEQPYTGPYKIIERISEQVYTLEVKGRPLNVSVERLKPAHMLQKISDTPEQADMNNICEPSTSATKTYPAKKTSVKVALS